MEATSRYELPRDYAKQWRVSGRRVIFHWNEYERWPDISPYQFTGMDVFEGVEFDTQEAAMAFDLDTNPRWQDPFNTWADAVAWLEAV